jgi:hypothetical protein
VRSITSNSGPYRSLVIDTANALEDVATAQVCAEGKKKSIGDFGYGTGFESLAAEWRILLAELDRAREAGLIVCLLAHSIVRTAQDPQLGEYDQHAPQLQKKTWGLTHRWCDFIGFAAHDAAKLGDEKRAILTGKRVIYTTPGSGFVAKNRYNMPAKIPLAWAPVETAIATHWQSVVDVRERVLLRARGTEFEAKTHEFVAQAGDDIPRLLAVEAALKEKLGGSNDS